MNKYKLKIKRFNRRKKHIRKTVFGTEERLRLSIKRSSKHIYAQIINDEIGKTLISASTLDKEARDQIKPDMKKIQLSKIVGQLLGKRALEAKIKTVVYDRNGFLYHGRVKALADAARKTGLKL